MIKKNLTRILLGTTLLAGLQSSNYAQILEQETDYQTMIGTRIEVPIKKYDPIIGTKPTLLEYSLSNPDEKVVTKKLVEAIAKVESNGNKDAVSERGAQGLMQIIPETWGEHCSDLNSPFNYAENKKCGTRYLEWLAEQISVGNPNWEYLNVKDKRKQVLVAYNAGLGTLRDRFDWNPDELIRNWKEPRRYLSKIKKAVGGLHKA